MGISDVITLLGGVALFLFGMSLMGEGLKKVAGNKLELVLYRLTNTPIKGFLLGTGVTAVIQSSSATSIMVVGFVNSGMMKVRQAIGIVLGAVLGTSITGWIICLSDIGGGGGWIELLSTSTLTGVIAVVGVALRMFSKKQANTHIGDILMGFAVLMFGMSAMSGAVEPLRYDENFTNLLTAFSNPLLGILVGVLFTSVLQSASAAVGILQALSKTGAINFDVALPIILGIAIGAAVPVLLSSLGANINGRRTAFVYLIVEVVGVIVVGALYYIADAIFHFSFSTMQMGMVSIALVNTLFRFAKVMILLPFIDALEALVNALVPDKHKATIKEDATLRLEERFVSHPALAIEQSRIAINAMAELSKDNLAAAFALMEHYTEEGYRKVAEMETEVDKYEDKLGSYLVKVTGQEMTAKQNEDVSKFLHTISDFERISDHALNIAESIKEIYEKDVKFSEEGKHELTVIGAAITEIVRLSVQAFVENNLELATRVEPLEELIDTLCDEMKLHHIDRVQHGKCTLNQGFVFNDLLTNYERVSDHCSNIAVAMIELESDEFDTHEYLNSLKDMKSESFARYLAEYQQQYIL